MVSSDFLSGDHSSLFWLSKVALFPTALFCFERFCAQLYVGLALCHVFGWARAGKEAIFLSDCGDIFALSLHTVLGKALGRARIFSGRGARATAACALQSARG